VSSAIVKNVLILGMGVVVEGFWKFPILNTAFFMLGVVTFSFIITRDLYIVQYSTVMPVVFDWQRLTFEK
jgi:hypothetical protein